MIGGPPSAGSREEGEDPEAGFALLVAVLAMALIAVVAAGVIASTRGTLDIAGAERQRARLEAAADAGVVLAVRALSMTERERRWAPDGRHRLRFDGIEIDVSLEDERGKIPLNAIDEQQARRMFEAAGAEGEALDAVSDAFLDWRDPDGNPRPHGAEAAAYVGLGRSPRNGPFRSMDELGGVRGVTPAMVARLRSAVTVIGAEGEGFDERYAHPLALGVMGVGAASAIEREREIAGERPVLPLQAVESLVGRGITIRVEARDGQGGRYRKAEIVQLTGRRDPAYLVRAVE
ncbi:general secretion pathway protein GspK [Sphingomonas sp.]|uniref:general secretion pathway protein GspK n=1 Tax=Sphingomonas sp. TaxID=28214 RepID=UPI003B008CCC